MQPLVTGSLQPLRLPAVGIRPVSLSAPQLTLKPETLPAQRLHVFPPTIDNVKAERCEEKLLTAEQLSTLESLSSTGGISFLNDVAQSTQPLTGVILYSVYRWSKEKDFDSTKTIVLLTIYLKLFQFFLNSQWRSQENIYRFFKESLLRNAIQHPPKSCIIFSPDESKDILLHFCNSFLTVLPLLRLGCLPNYRVHITWETSSEEQQIQPQK